MAFIPTHGCRNCALPDEWTAGWGAGVRIGLNLLPVLPGIGGAWHYVANLLDALAAHDRDNEYVGFVTRKSAPIFPRRPNFTAVEVPLHAPLRFLRVAYENSLLPTQKRGHGLDCVHHFFGTLPLFIHEPTVVTVFDLMVYARPSDFSPIKRAYLQRMRRRAARSATVLAPMSEATADALHERLQVPRSRMVVVPAAMRSDFRPREAPELATFRARYDLSGHFWLCVAGPYPHKNMERLLEAYCELVKAGSDWSLVIRGPQSAELTQRIAAASLQHRVRFLPWLAEEEMPLLYSAATALIFPSLYEGGGLPVMEAMACGCPVVASNLDTTREFAGDAALTFEPLNVADMVRAMVECERSPDLRSRMATIGRTLVSRLSPANVATACLQAYRAAVTVSPRDI